jgi:hypothetical protein
MRQRPAVHQVAAPTASFDRCIPAANLRVPHPSQLFAKGGIPLQSPRGPSPHILLVPPFAKSAKDGAPEDWFKRKMERRILLVFVGYALRNLRHKRGCRQRSAVVEIGVREVLPGITDLHRLRHLGRRN